MKLKRLSPFPGWLFSILHWPSPETTEWFCLRSAIWWVIQLAPCLHLFAVNSAFSGLSHYGSEGRWQMLLGGMLTVQVAAVLLGNVWLRVGALALFGTIWAFIVGLFWTSAPHGWLGIPRNTGIGIYGSLSADCMIVAIHLVRLWYVDHLIKQEKARREEGKQEEGKQEEGKQEEGSQEKVPHERAG